MALSWEDLATRSSTELSGDKSRGEQTTSLAEQVARRETIANDQRVTLFRVIVGIVCVSIVAVGTFIALLGYSLLKVEVPIAVAFISAMAVQSFVLIGLLARGLFMHAKPAPAQQIE